MKTEQIQSVIQDWVSELPFTQQAVLMCAMRGPDGVAKNHPAKKIVQFVRGAVMHPAYEGYSSDDDYHPHGFMRCDYQHFDRDANEFFSDVDELPHHFLMHLIHAVEIIGYSHPLSIVGSSFITFYYHACKSLHMAPESKSELFKRLRK